MKTRRIKLLVSGWVIAALALLLTVRVCGAENRKYANYRVDGKKLFEAEQYVLEQTENGKIADLSELIRDKGRRLVSVREISQYVESLKEDDRTTFLKDYSDRLHIHPNSLKRLLADNRLFIRAKFLETLLTGGFPGFKIHRHGVRIGNALVKEPLDVEGAKVEHKFWLLNCIFQEGVSFRDSWFKKNLVLSGSKVRGEANFERIKVGGCIFLCDAHFQGPVNFAGADVKGYFEANGAKFLNEARASFQGMKVGDDADFKRAIFKGPVDFRGVDIKHHFAAHNAEFQNETGEASFNCMKVGGAAFFNGAKFYGPVDFVATEIKSNFEADEAKFFNQSTKAMFKRMKVGIAVFLKKTEFHGPVDFTAAHIGNQFVASGAKFLKVMDSPDVEETSFNSIKVEHSAFFDEATLQGPVDLRFASFQNLALASKKPKSFLNVNDANLKLEGMTYKNIDFGDNWDKLLAFLEKSDCHAQPYCQLTTFLQQSGSPDRADEVYISGKKREWREGWSCSKFWQWPLKFLEKGFEKIFLDYCVGYGRHPGRVFYLSLVFVGLGSIIFSRPGVLTWEGGRPFKRIKIIRAVWYSLDAYLPFISLGPDKFYELSQEAKSSWVTTYFYIHQLAGYVLVSIGVAAMTGIIK
jgi:uncharacterized protein YjbI with pentapeptide repeats